MLIGKNFDRVEIEFFDLKLTSPQLFVGCLVIFFLSVFFAIRFAKLEYRFNFTRYWRLFFIVSGTGFLLDGFAHLLYLECGIILKVPVWYIGLCSPLFIERAMISIIRNIEIRQRLMRLSFYKLILAIIILTAVISWQNAKETELNAGVVVVINSAVGLFSTLAVLSYFYTKIYGPLFYWFRLSVLIFFPSIVVQIFNINFHPYFDRGSFTHVFVIVGMFFYYQGIKNFYNKRTDHWN